MQPTLGQRIKIIMDELSLTQAMISRASGIDITKLSRILADKGDVMFKAIETLYLTYPQINPAYLLGGILPVLLPKNPPIDRVMALERLIYWSFARPVELLRLKVGDLGPGCNSIHFPGTITKNRRAAAVPLPDAAAAMLRDYLEGETWPPSFFLLGTAGTPAERMSGENTFSERHRRVLRAIGMDRRGFNLYSWKHTGAAAAFDAGMSMMELRDRCRHASVQQTEEYLRDLRRVTNHTPPGAW